MKNIVLSLTLFLTMSLVLTANNIEDIYGKYDLDFTKDYMIGFGNNFGNLLDLRETQPYYVDIASAESQIKVLSDNNNALSIETDKYKTSIEELILTKNQVNDALLKLDLLLVDLRMSSAELYNLKETQHDKEMRQKLQVSIEENRQQIYDLTNKKNEMMYRIDEIENKIAVSKKYIIVNTLSQRKNNNRIELLNACIDFSKQDTSTLDSAINKSTSYQNEVNAILNSSF
jgi:chromosome segregation ATPase